MYTGLQANFENSRASSVWYESLKAIACGSFTHEGMPKEIDLIYLEDLLFCHGSALFFRLPNTDIYGVSNWSASSWDIYNNPILCSALTSHFELPDLRVGVDCVVIYNNIAKQSSVEECLMYAQKMYEIERTTQVNIKAQKTPVLITGDNKKLLDMKNVYKQYDGNSPVIYVDKKFSENVNLNVMKTDAPFVADKLHSLQNSILSDYLTQRGINNIDDKKERRLTDEIELTTGATNVFKNRFLLPREQAFKKINKIFGLNIKVGMVDERGADSGEVYSRVEENINEFVR